MTDKSPSFLRWREIPPSIWALGLVSLLMDVSSEMIHALLPLYLVGVLGASTLTVGVIEGIAEATASITKIFSGALSDYLGKRKFLAALGYGLAALTKPIFPLAPNIGWLTAARFVDRLGKGIRGAPRDALIADLTPSGLRGASFGLRQSLDTVGAFLGPLNPLRRAELARLGRAYWVVVGVATLFTLARFSEAFLLLRAQSVGLNVALVPAVMVVMNVVYAAAAWPAGALSDAVGRFGVMTVGFALLVLADLALAFAQNVVWVGIGVALWGLHMGLTQGLLSALVADTAPAALRGTAFGMFNLVTGLAMLAASILAGGLWDLTGPRGTFLAGAGFTAVALIALALVRGKIGTVAR